MGERLRREGYRGYFELDFLADANSGEMYLGELNPRVTGASSITNVTAVAYGDMPLFLFHLLEFMDVDYEIDVDELNRRWAHPGNIDDWTQFILKQTEDVTELITRGAELGHLADAEATERIAFARRDTDWHTVADESEAFYLRIASEGQYRYPGADLGILVTRGRFMDERPRADGPCPGLDHRHQVAVRERPARGATFRCTRAVRLQDVVMRMVPFTFRSIEELELGPKWQAVFEERWPHYRAWFLREGEAARPSYATSVRMLRAHMPELVPAYDRVVELAGGGDLAARMLSLYKPPPYLAACSQGAWIRDGGPDAGPQLRLRPVPDGGRDLVDAAPRATRDRHERLPLGAARRDERRGARRLADVRGAPRARRRIRHPDRRPVPARGLRDGGPCARSPRAPPVQPVAQPDDRRSRGRGPHGLPLARPRADLPGVPGRHEPPGHRGMARAGAGDPDDRARATHRPAARTSRI